MEFRERGIRVHHDSLAEGSESESARAEMSGPYSQRKHHGIRTWRSAIGVPPLSVTVETARAGITRSIGAGTRYTRFTGARRPNTFLSGPSNSVGRPCPIIQP